MFYLILLILIIITVRYLPFINLDASLRLQFWIRKLERSLEETIDRLERESARRKNSKNND